MSEPAEGPEALRRAFEEHYTPLLRLAVLLARDEPTGEDLVQEAFVRSARALTRLSPEEVRPYLRTVVVNLWRNRMRRRAVERRVVMRREPLQVEPAPSIEDRQLVWDAVARLPDRQRTCVVLRFFEDLPLEAIATLMRSSVGTVKSQLSRGLDRLRKELPDEP